MKKFRDEVLKSGEKGNYFADLYYKHSDELVGILMKDSNALGLASECMKRFLPIIELMNNGYDEDKIIVNEADSVLINQFIDVLYPQASPELQLTLNEMRTLIQTKVKNETGGRSKEIIQRKDINILYYINHDMSQMKPCTYDEYWIPAFMGMTNEK